MFEIDIKWLKCVEVKAKKTTKWQYNQVDFKYFWFDKHLWIRELNSKL